MPLSDVRCAKTERSTVWTDDTEFKWPAGENSSRNRIEFPRSRGRKRRCRDDGGGEIESDFMEHDRATGFHTPAPELENDHFQKWTSSTICHVLGAEAAYRRLVSYKQCNIKVGEQKSYAI